MIIWKGEAKKHAKIDVLCIEIGSECNKAIKIKQNKRKKREEIL